MTEVLQGGHRATATQLDGQDRAGAVVVRLLSGDRIMLRPDEILPLLLHRFLLAGYVVVTLLTVVLDVGGHRAVLPFDLHVATGLVAVAVMLAVVLVYLRARLAEGTRAVHLSPGLALAALSGMVASDTLHRLLGAEAAGWTPVQAVLLLVFYLSLMELMAMAAMRAVVPAALGHIRALHGAVPVASEGAGARGHPPVAVAEAEVLPGGAARLEPGAVLHLEACGNHVRVLTDAGRDMLPGPFAMIVARMSAEAGLLVHRSHWVAARAVRGYRRNGRDLRLLLPGGVEVPVALSRQAEVMAWLARLGHRIG